MPEFDASAISSIDQYKLMVGSVTPRPIALVSTTGKNGHNAAPFSFFNALGAPPPMLMFSAGDGEAGAKDTVANILETGDFVVHIVSHDIRDKMNVCAVSYARGVNEMEKAGFTTAPSRKVRAPRILEAPIAMECRLMQRVEVGPRPYHVVIGEVVYFHFRDGTVNDRFHVDVGAVDPIGRLAGKGGYTRVTDRFEMPRLPGGEGRQDK
jgi:flavin reductase (DIM6/NTAB) family NADH-FMN oxidoreductase RutF